MTNSEPVQQNDTGRGRVGKVVGGIFATLSGALGVYGWLFLLMSTSQGGGISKVAAPFLLFGALVGLFFTGMSLVIVAAVFGGRSLASRITLGGSGIMVVVVIIVVAISSI